MEQWNKIFINRICIAVIGVLILFSVTVSAAWTTYQFSNCAVDTTWTDCGFAQTDNGAYASADDTDVGRWVNYGIDLTGFTIDKVEIIADNYGSTTDAYMGFQTSWDHDLTYGPSKYAGWVVNEQRSYLDMTSDTTWTPTKLSNPEFRIKATCYTAAGPVTCNLEWLAVNVTYS